MKKFIVMLLFATLILCTSNGCTFLLLDAMLSEDETTTEETTTDITIEVTTPHTHRYNKVCEQSSVCLDCGEDDGQIVPHTTSFGLCKRCGREFRKQSPVTIIDRTYNIDYVGGVQWSFKIRNNTDKQIKYVTLQWHCYNAVGDYVYDDITGENYVRVRFTGPLDAHTTSNLTKNSTKFYDYNYKSSQFSEIIVEYMDGTTEKVTKYHDNISEQSK